MDDQTAGAGACAHCGAPLAGGRFCVNCGARIGTLPAGVEGRPSPTDTAERRYDVAQPPPAAAPAVAASGAPPVAPPPTQPAPPSYGRPVPGAGLWVAVGAAMLVMLLLGSFLLFHGTGGGSTSSAAPPIAPTTPPSSAPSSTSSAPSSAPTSPSATGAVSDVAGLAQASAPSHAPAAVDFAGQPVTYVAANLVDGLTDTCWRTAGDATGTVLTFRLDQPTRLTRVGLVNGYAKIAYDHGRRYDWYLGNRRVLGVDWIFDDGSSVSQRLGTSRTMQQIAIKPVTTSVVRLRITAVSPPGKGRASRNDTAISEVLLIGRTAG